MRILFVTARPPWPARRGDQARTAGWVSELLPRHSICVMAQAPPGFNLRPFPDGVRGRSLAVSRPALLGSLLGVFRRPAQVALHHHPAFTRAVAGEAERFRPDVAVLVLSRVAEVGDRLGGVPVVLDLIDSLSLNLERRAARQRLLGPLWRWEAERMRRWDRGRLTRVRAATVVSSKDRDAVLGGGEAAGAAVHVLPFGLTIPEPPPADPIARPVVCLSGNLGYFPTRDGAGWFAEEIWPRIRQAVPRAEWWLAGSRVGRGVRRLERLPGVRILADPQDLSAVRRQAAVAVAPLKSGTGTPIKVLEAMADRRPVVTTSLGAEGLEELRGGEVAIADDAEGFAAAVSRLLGDRQAARLQVARAWSWLCERHDLRRIARRFERLLEEVSAAPRRGRRSPSAAGSGDRGAATARE